MRLLIVTECCNHTILYGSLKSTFCVRVNLVTNRTGVVFFITCGKTGCCNCSSLCQIMSTNKFINRSIFVTLSVAHSTFFMLKTGSVYGRLEINYPFVVVIDYFLFYLCIIITS